MKRVLAVTSTPSVRGGRVRRHARCVRVADDAVGPGRAYRQDDARLQRLAGLVPVAGRAGEGPVRRERGRRRAEVLRQLHRQPQRAGHRRRRRQQPDPQRHPDLGQRRAPSRPSCWSTTTRPATTRSSPRRASPASPTSRARRSPSSRARSTTILLLLALQKAGLTGKDVTVKALPTDDAAAAFEAGPGRRGRRVRPVHHDRAGAAGQQGDRHLEGVPGRDPGPPGRSRPASWPDHPTEVQAVVKTWFDTLAWIKANKDAAIDIMAKKAGVCDGGLHDLRRRHHDLHHRSRT